MKAALSGNMVYFSPGGHAYSLTDFFSLAERHNFDGVELLPAQVDVGSPPETFDEIEGLCSETGIDVVLLRLKRSNYDGTPVEEVMEREFELCRTLGCNRLCVPPEPPARLSKMCQMADARHLRIIVQNYVNAPTATLSGTLEFIEEVDHPNIGLLYDPNCLYISGAKTADGHVEALGKWIEAVYVTTTAMDEHRKLEYPEYMGKDYPPSESSGEETIEMSEVYQALVSHGFAGDVILAQPNVPREEIDEYISNFLREIAPYR
jgi:sugar phosphate isomerase/epimerase